jgi:flagellar basal body rod protein FlgG
VPPSTLSSTRSGRVSRGSWLGGRRAKDELREVPNVDLTEQRRTAGRLSETVRRLDMAMQQRNWTTDIGD